MESGVPRRVLEAIAEQMLHGDQEAQFGRIGFVVLPSRGSKQSKRGRRLYLKNHVARFLGREFQ
jgi:hypothetical protein